MFFRRAPALTVGHAAPTFVLLSNRGEPFELVSRRGRERVVLAFYPEDDTAG